MTGSWRILRDSGVGPNAAGGQRIADPAAGGTGHVYRVKAALEAFDVPTTRPIYFAVMHFTGDYNPATWTGGICRIHADGTGFEQLPLPFARAQLPMLTPDGAWVYFQSDSSGAWQIYRCKPNGSQLQNLTQGNGLGSQSFGFIIGPVSNRVIYTAADTVSRIAIMDADGNSPYLIAPAIGYHYMAGISPNGRNVVFSHTADSYLMKTINLDTSVITTLTPGYPESFCGQPAPDGSAVVFFRRDGDVYRVPPQGGTVQRLTVGANGQNWVFGPGDTHGSSDPPKISPDSSKILYTAKVAGIDQIHVMNIDGSGQRPLTSLSGQCGRAHWGPDSRTIAFASYVDGKAELFVMDTAPGSLPVQLTDLGGGSVSLVTWSHSLGLQ